MSIPQLGDDSDGVQPCIFGECRRDNLEGISIGLEAVCLHSLQRLSVLREQARDVDFGGTTTGDESTMDQRKLVST